jgi:hypothetical protein
MSRVVFVMIPLSGKSASGGMIMDVIVVRRDGGGVDGGDQGEDEDESTSKRGEHGASRGGARKRAMAGQRSPYKLTALER